MKRHREAQVGKKESRSSRKSLDHSSQALSEIKKDESSLTVSPGKKKTGRGAFNSPLQRKKSKSKNESRDSEVRIASPLKGSKKRKPSRSLEGDVEASASGIEDEVQNEQKVSFSIQDLIRELLSLQQTNKKYLDQVSSAEFNSFHCQALYNLNQEITYIDALHKSIDPRRKLSIVSDITKDDGTLSKIFRSTNQIKNFIRNNKNPKKEPLDNLRRISEELIKKLNIPSVLGTKPALFKRVSEDAPQETKKITEEEQKILQIIKSVDQVARVYIDNPGTGTNIEAATGLHVKLCTVINMLDKNEFPSAQQRKDLNVYYQSEEKKRLLSVELLTQVSWLVQQVRDRNKGTSTRLVGNVFAQLNDDCFPNIKKMLNEKFKGKSEKLKVGSRDECDKLITTVQNEIQQEERNESYSILTTHRSSSFGM